MNDLMLFGWMMDVWTEVRRDHDNVYSVDF